MLACGLIVIIAYLLVAYWLKISYAPPEMSQVEPKVAGAKLLLRRPFVRFINSDFSVIVDDNVFSDLADTADNTERSPIEIYENDRPLGPAHSVQAYIGKMGHGRFSHWRLNHTVFVFSSSDNSDPQTNGRAYWAVNPTVSNSPPPKPD